jgi:hypothetical protein
MNYINPRCSGLKSQVPSTMPASLVTPLTKTLGIPYIFISDAVYTSIPSDWANFCDLVAGTFPASKNRVAELTYF